MANPNRDSKTHFYTDYDGSGIGAYGFDSLFWANVLWGSDIANSAGGTAVTGSIVIPQRSALVKITFYGAATTSDDANDLLMHLMVGPNALSGLTWPAGAGTTTAAETVAAVGNTVTVAAMVISTGSAVTAPFTVSFVPDIPQAWYDVGQTLDVLLNSSDDSSITHPIYVACLFAAVDPKPAVKTANPATDF